VARARKHRSPRNGWADRHAARRAWRQHRHDVTQPKSGRRHRAHGVESRHRAERTVAPRNFRKRRHSLGASDSIAATPLWVVLPRAPLEYAPRACGLMIDWFHSKQFSCGARFNSIQLGSTMDFSAHSIIWTILVGLVVGAIAKLLMPGKDPGGCIVTILLGI